MKILLINYEYPPLGGGGGVASEKLATGWADFGHEVHVLTSKAKDLPSLEKRGKVIIHRIPVISRKETSTATMISLVTFPIFAFVRGCSLFLKYRFDIINTHFAIPTGPVGFALKNIFRKPNILTIIGADIYDPTRNYSPHKVKILGWVVSKIINSASVVAAISENTKENAIKYYQPKKDISVIPLAFEKPFFTELSRKDLGLEEARRYLISIGRLVARKGYKYLIKAMDKLPNDISLLIIGDGPEKTELENLALKLNLGERVHFLGMVSEEKKFQYLAVSDIYVLSSLHEGFGIVLQEAMEDGLPIVSTNWGGQTDFLLDQENALLINPEDVDAIAVSVISLLQNPELMKKMSNNNKKAVTQFYIPNVSQKYLSIFEILLKK